MKLTTLLTAALIAGSPSIATAGEDLDKFMALIVPLADKCLPENGPGSAPMQSRAPITFGPGCGQTDLTQLSIITTLGQPVVESVTGPSLIEAGMRKCMSSGAAVEDMTACIEEQTAITNAFSARISTLNRHDVFVGAGCAAALIAEKDVMAIMASMTECLDDYT